MPWQRGMSLTCDVTVVIRLADSYISAYASSAGAAAETAASRKQAKYAALSGSYVFQTIALETLGPINESSVQLLKVFVLKITSVSADDKEGQFSSNDSLSLCRDSTPSCCMSRLKVMSTRTFSRPAF